MPSSPSRSRSSDSSPEQSCGERRTDGGAIGRRDETQSPGGLECDEEALRAHAARRLYQGPLDGYDAEPGMLAVVMVDTVASVVRMFSPLGPEPDVQAVVAEDPDARQGERAHAGHSAAVRGREQHDGRCPAEPVHAVSHPQDRARGERTAHVVTRDARSDEGARR